MIDTTVQSPLVMAYELITGSYAVRCCPHCGENHYHILSDSEISLVTAGVGRGIYREAFCKQGDYVIHKIEAYSRSSERY